MPGVSLIDNRHHHHHYCDDDHHHHHNFIKDEFDDSLDKNVIYDDA